MGIPTEEIESIFEPFFPASNTLNVQGVGMGRAIVQKCLDLLNATATVHSQIDVGTTFTLTFPNNAQPDV